MEVDSGIEVSEYKEMMVLPGKARTEPMRKARMMEPEKKRILSFSFS